MKLQFADYKSLSFDCYGTLIDWENGLLGYLQPLFQSFDVHVIDEWVLETFAELEPQIQAQGGSYRSVLSQVLVRFGQRLAFTPTENDLTEFGASVEYWQPYPDTVAALQSLQAHFQLFALSNIDDELFEFSSRAMGNPFQALISAQRVGAYKPDRRMFDTLLAEVEAPILHVAQSRFHDIKPASEIGLDTVWINRPTIDATRRVEASPTWTFNSMAEFAAAWS